MSTVAESVRSPASVTVTLIVAVSSVLIDGAWNVAFDGSVLSTVIVPAVPPTCSNAYCTTPTSSVLALASNADVEPSSIVVGLAVRLATGSWFTITLLTVIPTASVAVCPFPSSTVSSRVKVSPSAPTSGAVNDGVALLASLNVAAVPAVWVQAYVNVSLSGSELPEPSSDTVSPSLTVWSEPALAVGSWFTITLSTVTSTLSAVEVPPSLSVTVSAKVKVSPSAPTSGAVNDGVALLASLNVTDVPAVWVHE